MLPRVTDFWALLLAGIASGALNSVGGGGTFVALPALVSAGLSPVTANASSTVALLPGALSSAWAYRGEIVPVGTTTNRSLTSMSLLGGGVGAGLLLALPAATFDAAVPWLLAFATAVLAVGRPVSRLLRTTSGHPLDLGPRSVLAGQFVLAVYGGYFGGAVGIMMLALWSVGLGLDAAVGNPMRVAQLAAIYTPAAALFLIAGEVLADPIPLTAVLVGALLGGYVGAHLARRLPAPLLRAIVLTTAVTMTVLYFNRG
ncbi:sulfite exporter TauE/SafE family protein [Pseudonocardia xinjiangensis]|uniref:Probable membrane transporter protein n=1 Tax=Pseudonocardia xinjiangensis TaxID=75289 RepID=A0ABX1RGJ0_9PSEU|nr:sulfite exporter TauE/SafE family protein [Pseudonocardia xinjiangensis]NMH79147.1 sulfite exporter TauE/SafE family protein [Pseudonocardia xinjiangensis]